MNVSQGSTTVKGFISDLGHAALQFHVDERRTFEKCFLFNRGHRTRYRDGENARIARKRFTINTGYRLFAIGQRNHHAQTATRISGYGIGNDIGFADRRLTVRTKTDKGKRRIISDVPAHSAHGIVRIGINVIGFILSVTATRAGVIVRIHSLRPFLSDVVPERVGILHVRYRTACALAATGRNTFVRTIGGNGCSVVPFMSERLQQNAFRIRFVRSRGVGKYFIATTANIIFCISSSQTVRRTFFDKRQYVRVLFGTATLLSSFAAARSQPQCKARNAGNNQNTFYKLLSHIFLLSF